MANDVRDVTTPEVIQGKRKKQKHDESDTQGTSLMNPNWNTELGDSGTRIMKGIITEEYNPKLAGAEGIKVYDEMRRSDGAIKAIMRVVSLPIRKAKWRIEPADDSDEAREVADFVQKNIFDLMSITWNDFLRQSLLHLDFGVMVFEKVYEPAIVDGVERIILRKLAPRLPRTIMRWEIGDGGAGIEQQRQDGQLASIPIEKLVVFVNEMEGENWWGTSVLRAAYKHWYIKNNLYTIDAIAHERQGLGVPYVKLPEGAGDSDLKKAKDLLRNIRANDSAYIIEPPGYEVGFKDMQAKSTRDTEPSISHHNREIAKSVLAQFLELGGTSKSSSGSKALSEDHTDLFMQAEESVGDYVGDTFNKYVVRPLVDLNFNTNLYPKLQYAGIRKTDVSALSTAFASLTGAKVITPLMKDEMFFRDILGLPAVTEEELEEAKQEAMEKAQEMMKEMGNEEDPTDPKDPKSKDTGKSDTKDEDKEKEKKVAEKVDASEHLDSFKKKEAFDLLSLERSIDTKLNTLSEPEQMDLINVVMSESEDFNLYRKFFSEMREILGKRKNVLLRKKFSETNEFKSFRKLTFAEKKVNFGSLNEFMDRVEEAFAIEATRHLIDVKDQYIKKLTELINKGDISGIKDLELKYKNDYKDMIKATIRDSYVFGKNNAAIEMGIESPSNTKDLTALIDLTAENIARTHFEILTSKAKEVVIEQLPKATKPQVIALVEAAITNAVAKIVKRTAGIVVSGGINNGRRASFESNWENIHSVQRSELLDGRTCNYCLSVDARVLDKDDPFTKINKFHDGCRGIWVETLMDEAEKPPITGIPKSLRDRFNDSTGELSQPKEPLVKKDSLASKFINGQ